MTTLSDVSVLLVAHGSSRLPTARLATERLADALRDTALFAQVGSCFLKEPPLPSLDLVGGASVVVVPNFAGTGGFTRTIIPELLGLSGPVSRIGDRLVHYTAPLGAHPALPELLARRARALCEQRGLDPARVSLLLIGHGSSRPGASATTEAIAAAIRAQNGFAQVAAAFLEQAPFARDWPDLTEHADVIALPLLMSDGAHGTADIPALFAAPLPHDKRAHLLDAPISTDDWAALAVDLIRATVLPSDTASTQDRTDLR